jgi:hypothetical protein
MAKSGNNVIFHGSFKSKAAAVRKESSVRDAFILKRRISGRKGGKGEARQRWLVLSPR